MTIGRIPSVEGGIQPTIVDAKGDLIAATAADTVNRLAVGSNDQVLVADSAASTGLAWKSYGAQFAAGKNAIINGDFRIWQRGTSFSNPNSVYTADRFLVGNSTAVPTSTASQQTFTPGTAPVAGYEGATFYRLDVTNQGSSTGQQIITRLEDVRLFAGQTVTFSFWAKADASRTLGAVKFGQNFGSGGSGAVETTITLNSTALTTSWARYTGSISVPSISGKTIGSSSYVYLVITPPTTTYTLDTWGWQLEAGSVATAFQTATGTLQGELALAQRYYQKSYSTATAPATNTTLPGIVFSPSGNVVALGGVGSVTLKVEMRVAPTVTIYSYTTSQTGRVSDNSGTDLAASSGNANYIGTRSFIVQNDSGGTLTAAYNGFLFHYVASAEL